MLTMYPMSILSCAAQALRITIKQNWLRRNTADANKLIPTSPNRAGQSRKKAPTKQPNRQRTSKPSDILLYSILMKLTAQAASRTTNQPNKQSTVRAASQPPNRQAAQTCRSPNQPASQPTDQPSNQPASQQASQPKNTHIKQTTPILKQTLRIIEATDKMQFHSRSKKGVAINQNS